MIYTAIIQFFLTRKELLIITVLAIVCGSLSVMVYRQHDELVLLRNKPAQIVTTVTKIDPLTKKPITETTTVSAGNSSIAVAPDGSVAVSSKNAEVVKVKSPYSLGLMFNPLDSKNKSDYGATGSARLGSSNFSVTVGGYPYDRRIEAGIRYDFGD